MKQKLNKYKMEDIISKINELVEVYAKKFQLEKYVVQELEPFHFEKVPIGFVKLKKIDFKQFITDRDNPNYPDVEEFVKKISGLVSNSEREMLFIKKNYSDYATILYVIEMLLFDTPREPKQNDLEDLNKLYRKYTTNNGTKAADNKN